MAKDTKGDNGQRGEAVNQHKRTAMGVMPATPKSKKTDK